jgi:hypothetical protein
LGEINHQWLLKLTSIYTLSSRNGQADRLKAEVAWLRSRIRWVTCDRGCFATGYPAFFQSAQTLLQALDFIIELRSHHHCGCQTSLQRQISCKGLMQSANTSRPPQQNDEHLSSVTAKMFLAALPERIQWALLAHSQETQYPLEMVLEMAIAGFLDSEAITFADCRPKYE